MITLKHGDLPSSDCNVICHQVNCRGVMDGEISERICGAYPRVYDVYRYSHLSDSSTLGDIDITMYRSNSDNARFIINMYAQDDYLFEGMCHTDYGAFRKCCVVLKEEITSYQQEMERRRDLLCVQHFKIGFPYNIGCGLAGGDWKIVESILRDEFDGNEWDVEIWKL